MSNYISTDLDDIPLVLEMIRHLHLDTILDTFIPTHGNTMNHNELTNGEAYCIWLTYLLTQGNHCKWQVDKWVKKHSTVLSTLWGTPVPGSDFSDDRLTTLAKYLSCPKAQHAIDYALGQLTMQIYAWGEEAIRLDGTHFRGYHHAADGIMRCGYAKSNAKGTSQFTLMAASTESGQYLTGHFHPGQLADDGLYRPVLTDLFSWGPQGGMLFIGDSKMGALATRAHIARHGHYYYMPLPDGHTAKKDWAVWLPAAIAGTLPGFTAIWRDEELLGYGFEWTRSQQCEGRSWTERVHLVRSMGQVESERKTLQRHLEEAEKALHALTRTPKRGVAQYTEEGTITAVIEAILTKYQVQGLLTITMTTVPYPTHKPMSGATQESEKSPVRYVIVHVQRLPEVIRALEHTFGWRIFVTNAPPERLSLPAGILLYRRGAGQGIERMNRIFKDHTTLGLDRIYVSRDDQIVGMAYLVTLALRVMMDIEVKVRQGLAKEKTTLTDYSSDKAMNARPTTKRMLEQVCFYGVSLGKFTEQEPPKLHISELPEILKQMLRYLDLPPTIYTQLVE